MYPVILRAFLLISLVCDSFAAEGESLRRERRQDESLPIIVTTIESEPYLMVTKGKDGGEDVFHGFIPDLLNEVCEDLQIDCKLRLVKDNQFGHRDENGTWKGMIGELVRKEADMAAGPLTITSQREEVVDFSKPFMQSGLTVLGRRPHLSSSGPAWITLLEPFADAVWLAIAVSYVVVSLVFFLLNRFLSAAQDQDEATLHKAGLGETLPSLLDSFWWSYRTLLWQGGQYLRTPTSLAVRILAAFWFMFVLLTLFVYIVTLNSFYPAFFPARTMALPISNAEELSSQTQIPYGVVSGGASSDFFRTSAVPVYEKMWAFMSTQDTFVTTVEEGIEKVRDDGLDYYFITDSPTVQYELQQEPCDLVQIGGLLTSQGFGLATPRGSALRDRLNLAILTMHESGILEALKLKWWHEKGQCPAPQTGTGQQADTCENVVPVMSLSLTMFSAPLVALGVGLMLTLLVAVAEGLYGKRKVQGSYLEDEQQLGTTGPGADS